MRSLVPAVLLLGACAASPIGPDGDAPPATSSAPPAAAPHAELAIPSCADLSALWMDRYHEALKASWLRARLDCGADAPPSLDRGFAEAAFVLDKTRFRTDPLPPDTEPPPADMLSWTTQKYLHLVVDPTAEYPATDVEAKTLHFYPGIADETGFQVVGNLIHEARHADGLAYLHVECLDGPNQGVPMCDDGLSERFTEGGPHAVALLYFAWVAARGNWPADKKAGLRELSSWLVDERINATPAQRAAWKARWLVDW